MSSSRKDDHIRLALLQKEKANRFDDIVLESTDLPDFGVNDVNLKSSYLGYEISYPIYINAMTGGSEKAHQINEFLSKLASHFNIPMVTGSQSIALKDSNFEDSFKVTRLNHKGILVGNINPNYQLEDAKRAITMIDANALSIHLNLVQELVMPEGDRDFTKWSENIKSIVNGLDKPVVVKQVGMGLSQKTINKLKTLGVKNIDVAGSGGTNFLEIETKRGKDDYSYLEDFSLDTADILIQLKNEKDLNIYASGGIRNPLDVIKSLVLGAKAVGMSKFFLNLYKLDYEEAVEIINKFIYDLKKIMVILGVKEIADLNKVKYKIK
ncbi:type 2 isopentenyl-diphosphate Delta-isomerase [Acholeplasma hippikon]|uniref:Isopentenyl-diphosphate delta-isomerase n=1 Tax=Acholeplasma hippikon TaxID=264636 RepID=A0A449BJ83_9MOLU|nr:type 2 isopentenyl-diphosphate Delta-isomerase [Acholeplasma hippikon]VEU82490.1 Isopentenyl-diphosphate delta-isomerase [Acholeplasma hippikon]